MKRALEDEDLDEAMARKEGQYQKVVSIMESKATQECGRPFSLLRLRQRGPLVEGQSSEDEVVPLPDDVTEQWVRDSVAFILISATVKNASESVLASAFEVASNDDDELILNVWMTTIFEAHIALCEKRTEDAFGFLLGLSLLVAEDTSFIGSSSLRERPLMQASIKAFGAAWSSVLAVAGPEIGIHGTSINGLRNELQHLQHSLSRATRGK